MVTSGITIAPITLQAGVSSAEAGEPPVAELFDVPLTTARLVNLTHATGGRVRSHDGDPRPRVRRNHRRPPACGRRLDGSRPEGRIGQRAWSTA